VFALDELESAPEQLVSDVPGGTSRYRRGAGGYRYTIVDGTIVQQDGALTRARSGRFLRATDR
jgi:N-acyl-D-aspartate/D-glutamate deacylase